MAHIDSSEIAIDQSQMTVLLAGGEILSVPLTARVDTDTGDVTFHTDPGKLTPAVSADPNPGGISDSSTGDDASHGAVVAPSPSYLTPREP